MRFPEFILRLPAWVSDLAGDPERLYPSVEARMALAIELSRRNVRLGTGGPFGAAVFDLQTGKLIAPGVNLVVPTSCSAAHAEIVAITMAQQKLGHFDLAGEGMPPCQLASSTEPCAMCMGAIPWSGVRSLVCGARDEDARRIGFDEGPKIADWAAELGRRGITVTVDVCRAEAVAVLEEYRCQGGMIYSGRLGQNDAGC